MGRIGTFWLPMDDQSGFGKKAFPHPGGFNLNPPVKIVKNSGPIWSHSECFATGVDRDSEATIMASTSKSTARCWEQALRASQGWFRMRDPGNIMVW